MLSDDQILSKAEALARQAAAAGVREEQLSLALVHLKRHRDVGATLAMLGELKTSPFARRTRQTEAQIKAVDASLRLALQGASAWEDAARVVGWARRLLTFYKPARTYGRPRDFGGGPERGRGAGGRR